jgi:hypothetical protein
MVMEECIRSSQGISKKFKRASGKRMVHKSRKRNAVNECFGEIFTLTYSINRPALLSTRNSTVYSLL